MAQPSLIDVATPFDPTGYPSLSGAQIQQFGSGIVPYTDKGFIVITDDVAGVPTVPDATGTPKWQTYMWVRRSATAISAYLWNPAAAVDLVYQQWVSINIAAIGVGSIQGFMIADNTIADIKIISLDWSKITGIPGGFLPSGAAGGDLTGTYPNPAVGAGAITGTKIAAATITHANIAPLAVEPETDLDFPAVADSQLRVNAGATAIEWFVPGSSTIPTPSSASQVYAPLVVSTPYTDGYTINTGGGTIQSTVKMLLSNAGQTSITIIPNDASLPTAAEGDLVTGSDITFTPINTASIIRVRVSANVTNNANGGSCTLALFDGVTCLRAVTATIVTANILQNVALEFAYSPGSVTPINFSLRFGPSAANTAYLERNAGGNLFTTAGVMTYNVEEILGTLL